MMLFIHYYSLGFILLALLVSPICAAPTPTPTPIGPYGDTYIVQVLDRNGYEVQVPTTAQNRIKISISTMATQRWRIAFEDNIIPVKPEHIQLIARGRHIEPGLSDMLYYNLTGVNFCTNMTQFQGYGYGYAVTSSKEGIPHDIVFGGAVSDAKNFDFSLSAEEQKKHVKHEYTVYYAIALPQPSAHRMSDKIYDFADEAAIEFFEKFARLSGWVMVMARIKNPEPPIPITDAAVLFRENALKKAVVLA
ncbi:hypothetical protein BDP27DRAFT_1446368 [Rhodocollybia butyracea]|uniref:Uncharacterized protein n=1 Tax=Rhodocollybia butyracea TaxID=206335 RepID=A0A9P5Q074_9AGAR|nr:hypothetical protein BDP27DRAFT_1446368 [Rhodocollybia butyracea]